MCEDIFDDYSLERKFIFRLSCGIDLGLLRTTTQKSKEKNGKLIVRNKWRRFFRLRAESERIRLFMFTDGRRFVSFEVQWYRKEADYFSVSTSLPAGEDSIVSNCFSESLRNQFFLRCHFEPANFKYLWTPSGPSSLNVNWISASMMWWRWL